MLPLKGTPLMMSEENHTTPGKLMDVREVADFLKLAPGTIYHLVSRGQLPCVRLSARCVRFRRSDIEAWIEEKVEHERTNFSDARRQG
jgi:excisionase family DNA binding protein